ncbi:MAG: YraN family protein [Roseovarius sp.]
MTGLAAERAVARAYERRGADLVATRWRGQGGEIDLVLHHEGVWVFCEVKVGASFAAAAERLRPAQARRIHQAASEYVARTPAGQLAPMRFDLALVDGVGRVEIREAAFSHF